MPCERVLHGQPCRRCKRKTINRRGVCAVCLRKPPPYTHTMGHRCEADEPERARRVSAYAAYVRLHGRLPDDYE